MKTFLIITLFLLISGLMQHVIHEILHLAVGKCVGLSVKHVTWFSHRSGTKVTFQDEDAVIRNSDHHIPKEWIIMNLAGIIGTTLAAYIFVLIYLLLPLNLCKLFFWVLSAVFLMSDAGYAVLCAFAGSGDLYLVSKYFHNSILIKLISVCMLIVNLTIFIVIT